jgi:23S rRNA (uridine2552-2'-O)-methyltransferase
MQKRKRDQYYRLAKRRGLRSRAIFKLSQANERYRIIRPDDVVVDLGAAPGGWLQAAKNIVGPQGFVLGVDIQSIEPFKSHVVQTLVADLTDPHVADLIRSRLPAKADVVLSDVSPKVSGVWDIDQARQIHLATRSFVIAQQILQTGGNFFVKVFQGPDEREFREQVKKSFKVMRIVKPPASRSESSEIYLLGLAFLGHNQGPPLPELQ